MQKWGEGYLKKKKKKITSPKLCRQPLLIVKWSIPSLRNTLLNQYMYVLMFTLKVVLQWCYFVMNFCFTINWPSRMYFFFMWPILLMHEEIVLYIDILFICYFLSKILIFHHCFNIHELHLLIKIFIGRIFTLILQLCFFINKMTSIAISWFYSNFSHIGTNNKMKSQVQFWWLSLVIHEFLIIWTVFIFRVSF